MMPSAGFMTYRNLMMPKGVAEDAWLGITNAGVKAPMKIMMEIFKEVPHQLPSLRKCLTSYGQNKTDSYICYHALSLLSDR